MYIDSRVKNGVWLTIYGFDLNNHGRDESIAKIGREKMDNKTTAMVVAVVLVVLVAAGAYMILNAGNDGDVDMSSKTDDIRLKIYGNVNGDDAMDSTDLSVLERLVSDGVSDWKDNYVYADVDQDGSLTQSDIDLLKKYLDGESMRLYYDDYWGRVAYVNYPLGDKIGADMSYTIQFTGCVGVYDKMYGSLTGLSMMYDENVFPGVSNWVSIGSLFSLTIESIASSGVDTLILWSEMLDMLPAQKALWEEAVQSGLADQVSFVMVPVTGTDCDSGALMLGAMYNTEEIVEKSRAYADSVAEIKTALASIGNSSKKTVTLCYFTETTDQSTIYMSGGGSINMIWPNLAISYPEGWESLGNVVVGYEGLASAMTDTFVCYFQQPTGIDRAGTQAYLETKMQELFQNIPAYESGDVYCIDADLLTGIAAPWGAYLLACMLYPDDFSLEHGLELYQQFIDEFGIISTDSADTGFIFIPGSL